MKKTAVVIGSGFAGISAASFLARDGWEVTVLEKHDQPGGRARQFTAKGFSFDMGPSWYWMPDVFERYFQCFGKKVSDYYELTRLDPSYRVYWLDDHWDIPADYDSLKNLFEKIETGAGKKLDKVMTEAAYKYKVGIGKLVHKPGLQFSEFLDKDLVAGLFRLDVFNSVQDHIYKHFESPKIRELLCFPVLFLGALAQHTPALYTLMNYADIKGGTWYPKGGMYSIVTGMCQLATELGVKFCFNEDVEAIETSGNKAIAVKTGNSRKESTTYPADIVVSNADYHFTETHLLPEHLRSYSNDYWKKRVMAPSSLLYYVGIDKKINGLRHHSLFFDVPFAPHANDIYTTPRWPEKPLFYVSATSVTDATQAPAGQENLFFLIPVAAGLKGDDEPLRRKYFEEILSRFEQRIGTPIKEYITYYRSFAVTDFKKEYNAFRGNAYGLANTLKQTAILKPSCVSKKVENLFYTGQLTVPGPGVPPSLISGEVVAGVIKKKYC